MLMSMGLGYSHSTSAEIWMECINYWILTTVLSLPHPAVRLLVVLELSEKTSVLPAMRGSRLCPKLGSWCLSRWLKYQGSNTRSRANFSHWRPESSWVSALEIHGHLGSVPSDDISQPWYMTGHIESICSKQSFWGSNFAKRNLLPPTKLT